MGAFKMFGITAAALLCLSLARPDSAAAADAAAARAQTGEAVTSGAAPRADEPQTTVNDLANLFAHMSAGMSQVPQQTPTAPEGSVRKGSGCELVCCVDIPLTDMLLCCSDLLGGCWIV